jgi:hypothetical protein
VNIGYSRPAYVPCDSPCLSGIPTGHCPTPAQEPHDGSPFVLWVCGMRLGHLPHPRYAVPSPAAWIPPTLLGPSHPLLLGFASLCGIRAVAHRPKGPPSLALLDSH